MTKQISLSQGKFALVDDEDFAAVSAYSWYLTSRGYVVTNRGHLRLHHLVFGDPPAGHVVDHIDGNLLNCCRSNLRSATVAQNAQNRASHRNSTSRFKGVSWDSRNKLWRACICFNKTKIHLGLFVSELAAARAYNAAATQYHGEYARLNVIPDDTTEPLRYRQAVPIVKNSTSQYRGVCLPIGKKRWRALIGVSGKTIYLGYFDTEEKAARAYDAAAKLHHGDHAFLNFPD